MAVPVWILTGLNSVANFLGYLGSGKTTLLNRLSRQLKLEGKKVTVFENEFALEFGIELELIKDRETSSIEEVFDFGNGCVCCSLSSEFKHSLANLPSTTEAVLVELTGIADPRP